MKQFTEKTCPGCGQSRKIAPNTVCGACGDAIANYAAAKAAAEAASAERVRVCFMGNRAAIPSGMYSLASKAGFAEAMGAFLRHVGFAQENTKVKEWHNVAPVPYKDGTAMDKDREQDWMVRLPLDVEKTLGPLYLAISVAIREAEAVGQERGQNLLMQLNAGTLSLSQFDEEKGRVATRGR